VTIQQQFISLDCPSEWKQALTGIRHSFGHTWENCYAMYLTTGMQTYLYCFEAEGVRIVCPVAEREHGGAVDIVKPFGFSGFTGTGSFPGFHDHWKEFAKQRGYVCGYLGINPLFHCSSYSGQEDVFHYDAIHLLDLTLDQEELWANLSTNRKRQLKDWSRISADFIFDKLALIDFFHAQHQKFFSSKGAERFYSFSDDTLSFLFNLDNVLMVGAGGPGGVEAVSVFAYTDDVGEYLFNISLPSGKEHSSFLIWYGVNHLKELGIPLLNLGGGQGGVGEFKRYFGGKELPLCCSKQVYDPQRYRQLCQSVDADPDDLSGYFPAYRKTTQACLQGGSYD